MAQTIDRDRFTTLLDHLDEGDGALDAEELYRGVLELLEPAQGVVLSPEDAAVAVQWYDELNGPRRMEAHDILVMRRLAAA